MRSLRFPNINCEDPYAICLRSVSAKHGDYIDRMTNISPVVATEWSFFNSAAVTKNFYQLTPCRPKDVKQIIVGGVKKSELKVLYEKHMLKLGSDARKIYDTLRACSDQYCPLCGIRKVYTLDHYLPKARYPLQSVNPKNLVPACRECNIGKLDKIFLSKDEQTLYPYSETSNFYLDDWISATVRIFGGEFAFEFLASPPSTWSAIDQARAINHFKVFNLDEAYGLNTIVHRTFINNTCKFLWEEGGAPMVDRWCQSSLNKENEFPHIRAIYRAILADVTICQYLI